MSDKNIQIRTSLLWRVAQNPKSGVWIGVCPALNISVQGDTRRELDEAIQESVDMMLRELHSTGDLENFLREHGWHLAEPLPPRRQLSKHRFKIPLSTERVGIDDLQGAPA